MKKIKNFTMLVLVLSVLILSGFKSITGKLISKDTHISFYSHTSFEDITANNYKVISTLDTSTGDVVFSVPMQSFEFEKTLMQKHYNSGKFLNTKKFPKSKFIGKITNLETVEFSKDGTYQIMVSGDLTIKGTTRTLNEKATIKIEGGKVSLETKIDIELAGFGITFSGGKPSTNIAKVVQVSVTAIYATQ